MGTSAQTYQWADATHAPRIKINNSNGVTPHASGSGEVRFMSLEISAGNFTAPPGSVLKVGGDSDSGINSEGFEVNATGGFTHNSGTLRWHANRAVSSDAKCSEIIVSSPVDVYNLKIAHDDTSSSGGENCYSLITGTVNVKNDFTLAGSKFINGGTINVEGNAIFSGTQYQDGTVSINYTRAGAQTINNSGNMDLPNGNVTVNKSGGTLTFLSNIDFENASQNFTITNGTVDMAGYTFNVGNVLTIGTGTTLTQNGGTLTYGSLTNNGTLNP